MRQHKNPDGSNGPMVPGSASIGEEAWIGDSAAIGDSATIGKWASIGDSATIGKWATIGEGAWISHSAWIGERAWIGKWATVQTIRRTDGYWFALVPLESGDWRVTAECRDFTPAEGREHWTRTRGGTPLGAETLAILDYFDARIALGIGRGKLS